MTPTQRSMQLLRNEGKICWVVERFISMAGPLGKRIDLFNIIDIIALTADSTIGIQSCGQDFASHLHKLTEVKADESACWLNGPRQLFVYGWRKTKLRRGSAAMRWRPRIAQIVMDGGDLLAIEDK